MPQKICIISFDHWNYDKHIVTALQKRGIDSFHIKIGGFKHKSIWARIYNTFSKVFLGKNPKLKKRQEYIIKTLQERGPQDQILVINPELIDKQYHLKIKSFSKKYIAYLYDSTERCPIEHLLDGIFDEIFSFDRADIAKYNFKETNNYNYIETINTDCSKIKNDVLYIASFDNRIYKLLSLKEHFKKMNLNCRFIIIGKKTILFKIKSNFSNLTEGMELRRKRIKQNNLKDLYLETKIVLDIVRKNQSGLSFRIFEAMAFERKIITNNQNVKHYDFYNPNNIMVIENENYTFDHSFFTTKYDSLPSEIYNKYTISNWVSTIFNLQ